MPNPAHWNHIYTTKPSEELSWTPTDPGTSLQWILNTVPDKQAPILDCGGGEGWLAEALLQEGYEHITVLDIAGAALARAQARLAQQQAAKVSWVEADVLVFEPTAPIALWHDRAVFHFLTEEAEVLAYRNVLERAGPQYLLMATFSDLGPLKCSGLPVQRYTVESLQAALGPGFRLLRHQTELHTTPWGSRQDFLFALFNRVAELPTN